MLSYPDCLLRRKLTFCLSADCSCVIILHIKNRGGKNPNYLELDSLILSNADIHWYILVFKTMSLLWNSWSEQFCSVAGHGFRVSVGDIGQQLVRDCRSPDSFSHGSCFGVKKIIIIMLRIGFPGGLVVKYPPAMQEMCVQSLGQKIPCRKKWHPTSAFLPEKSHRQRSLAAATVHGVTKELDIT